MAKRKAAKKKTTRKTTTRRTTTTARKKTTTTSRAKYKPTTKPVTKSQIAGTLAEKFELPRKS